MEAVAVEGEVVDVVIRGCREGRRRLRGGRGESSGGCGRGR
jgi:hypothetical protein